MRKGHLVPGSHATGSNQQDRARILGKQGVGGQQRDPLMGRLGDEDAVEGVFVDWRKAGDGERMVAGDVQLQKFIGNQLVPEAIRIYPEVWFVPGILDGHFPDSRRAEKNDVACVLY